MEADDIKTPLIANGLEKLAVYIFWPFASSMAGQTPNRRAVYRGRHRGVKVGICVNC
jgi:hypothetical protein